MSEWPIEHAWKACVPQGTEGSNPSLSAKEKPTPQTRGFVFSVGHASLLAYARMKNQKTCKVGFSLMPPNFGKRLASARRNPKYLHGTSKSSHHGNIGIQITEAAITSHLRWSWL